MEERGHPAEKKMGRDVIKLEGASGGLIVCQALFSGGRKRRTGRRTGQWAFSPKKFRFFFSFSSPGSSVAIDGPGGGAGPPMKLDNRTERTMGWNAISTGANRLLKRAACLERTQIEGDCARVGPESDFPALRFGLPAERKHK
jgi:hypothetical protein